MTVLHQIAASVDLGEMLGVTTALFLAAFMAWTAWAYAPGNRERHERAGRIPFEDGEDDAS